MLHQVLVPGVRHFWNTDPSVRSERVTEQDTYYCIPEVLHPRVYPSMFAHTTW